MKGEELQETGRLETYRLGKTRGRGMIGSGVLHIDYFTRQENGFRREQVRTWEDAFRVCR